MYSVSICWRCKYVIYDEDLELYEIRCEVDKKIHDENSSCLKFKFDKNHTKINPRVKI